MDFAPREIETLRGHTGVVWCVSWNPATGVEGVPAMFVSCGADKAIIWEQNATTGSFQRKEVLPWPETSIITWCVWAASGSILVTSSIDGSICIWKSTIEGRFTIITQLELCYKISLSVSLNASGDLIATCDPEEKIIRIWKIAEELKMVIELSKVEDSKGYAQMIQWHPIKDILFACGFDNTIKIWVPDAGMVNWDCTQTLGESVHSHKIRALAFNGRGNKIVACSDDLTITIWRLKDTDEMRYGGINILNGVHLCTFTGYHDQKMNSVLWSREEIICTGAADGAICFFILNGERMYSDEPAAHKLLLKKEHAHDNAINSVQWCSQDNLRLASASDDGTIKIWELASIPQV